MCPAVGAAWWSTPLARSGEWINIEAICWVHDCAKCIWSGDRSMKVNCRTSCIVAAVNVLLLSCKAVTVTNDAAKSSNSFAIDLYSHLANEPGNLVFSPFSVEAILAMAREGAKSETARQMDDVLYLKNGDVSVHTSFSALQKQLNHTNVSDSQFISANSIWVRQGYSILSRFKSVVEDQYGGIFTPIDLTSSTGDFDLVKAKAARKTINLWVKEQTGGRIEKALPDKFPDAATRLILLNATYFKGVWEIPFDKKLTENYPFWIGVRESVPVPTMCVKGRFNVYRNSEFQLLRMSYRSNRFSMMIFLPNQKDGLAELERKLTKQFIEKLPQESHLREIKAYLPRFKVSSGFSLKKPLQDMGMSDAFSETGADFSGITHQNGLYIEDMIQNAYVEVNEEGTEAAAATLAVGTQGIMEVFNIDHPFLFMIIDDRTGTVVFMGRVTNPLN